MPRAHHNGPLLQIGARESVNVDNLTISKENAMILTPLASYLMAEVTNSMLVLPLRMHTFRRMRAPVSHPYCSHVS